MHMNSNWYNTSGWYAPLAPQRDQAEEEALIWRRKRRRRIVCALLITAILLNATAFAYSPVLRSLRSAAPSAEDTERQEAEEFPDQYHDFFKDYYTAVTSDPTDIRIPACSGEEQFDLLLTDHASNALTLQQLYEKCAPSIVGIAGYTEGKPGYNWGTGVVLTADGLILTNTHVIDSCDTAKVFLAGRDSEDVQLVGADSVSDLAVLKIKAEGLTPAEFGDSSRLSVGDGVAAIGNPLGSEFSDTLTNGIISAIDRDVTYNGRSMTLLQTNTALNEGNSGGALFNMYGQVVGITNMKMMSAYSSIEGIGFAIPSSTVKTVVSSIISYGEVKGRPTIGITVGEIPENVHEHYDLPEGLYIAAVTAGSDAEKQGIQEGDILIAVNGVTVTTTEEVNDMKNACSVGDQMKFSVWRDGELIDFSVTLMDLNDLYS